MTDVAVAVKQSHFDEVCFLSSRTTDTFVTATTQQPFRLLPPLQHARLFHHFLFAAPAPACRVQGNTASYSCPQKRALHQIPVRAVL
jgi:hypothetical protein